MGFKCLADVQIVQRIPTESVVETYREYLMFFSELKSDCKSYFAFLVDKFSEAVNTEITTFSIIA